MRTLQGFPSHPASLDLFESLQLLQFATDSSELPNLLDFRKFSPRRERRRGGIRVRIQVDIPPKRGFSLPTRLNKVLEL